MMKKTEDVGSCIECSTGILTSIYLFFVSRAPTIKSIASCIVTMECVKLLF